MDQMKGAGDGAPHCKDTIGLIQAISHKLRRHLILTGEDSELTDVQRRVLHFILLATIDHEIYQKDVEAKFHIRRSTATGILQLMEKRGLICRESVEWDARLKKILPTEKSLALREEVLDNIHRMEAAVSRGIRKEDFEACAAVLRQINQNLSENEKEL